MALFLCQRHLLPRRFVAKQAFLVSNLEVLSGRCGLDAVPDLECRLGEVVLTDQDVLFGNPGGGDQERPAYDFSQQRPGCALTVGCKFFQDSASQVVGYAVAGEFGKVMFQYFEPDFFVG